MANKKQMISVTRRALIQRINRVLAKEGHAGQALKTTRGVRMRLDVGDYWIIDYNTNAVVGQDINLEELGREMEILKPWEKLVDD